ncbi:hypothetical protein HYPSUDRAFT_209652 [Hypholoma sublateritium FD-334 SS-4]|uniref:Uncharacterized protein n=1 Tax=Hypholoma sublateritium (strain FD-334 SS-4) TaxID=945553 RepID=A0A0D2LR56_HYPSF|nr:hypothetical protein HYPSUDRAFT_209652 [Hypholoma sublateritium FD-334 SS-4]
MSVPHSRVAAAVGLRVTEWSYNKGYGRDEITRRAMTEHARIRNLCALEWIVSNPKGTTDEFSAYYDGLPAEDKQKWEKLSVEAKESGKTPGERVMGLQS